MLKSPSQLASVPSMAISHEDRMAAFSVTCSGSLFGLFASSASKRAAQSSRPWWVILPCRRLSKRDEKMRDKANYHAANERLPCAVCVVVLGSLEYLLF